MTFQLMEFEVHPISSISISVRPTETQGTVHPKSQCLESQRTACAIRAWVLSELIVCSLKTI